MSGKLLQPDHEGHYSNAALELDRESLRRFPAGSHPLDSVAASMAAQETRRRFFRRGAQGIGALALASLLGDKAQAGPGLAPTQTFGTLPGMPHFAPKAK